MSAVAEARAVLGWACAHPANHRRRLRAAARVITFQVRGRLGRRTLATVGRDGRMWVALHETGGSKAVYANPPDWNEMHAWRRLLGPGDLFVDVGSNVGGYALWAADAGATVIAVEPAPVAAARLRENVALNDFPITVVQCGLSSEPGRMRLTRGQDTTNHLVFSADLPGDDIEVDTLDNLLGDRIAAGVKIDVEGAERLVLEGARRALSQRRIRVLQLEWNAMSERVLGESRSPVAGLLRGYGYTFARPDREGVLRATDALDTAVEDLFAVADRSRLRGG